MPKSDPIYYVVGPLLDQFGGKAHRLEHERNILPCGEVGKELEVLKHDPYIPAIVGQLASFYLSQVNPANGKLASTGTNLPGQSLSKVLFPDPVSPIR